MNEIITERLIIRNFRTNDWKDLLDYLSDEEVIRYSPYEVYNEEMAKNETKKRTGTNEILAVCLKDNNKVIGELFYEKGEFDAMEIGFFFNSQYQGKGYAKESATALINFAFIKQGIRRITARCDSLNLKSRNLLDKLKMRKEGELKKHIYFKHDVSGNPLWADTCLYGILRDEWNL